MEIIKKGKLGLLKTPLNLVYTNQCPSLVYRKQWPSLVNMKHVQAYS